MSVFKFISPSEEDTKRLAQRLALMLRANDCLALIGNFGSGKTTFTKGLADGLGVRKKNYVCSPSFVILKIYPGRLSLYHFDLYRLDRFLDWEHIGLDEFMEAGGVAVIEWAERIKKYLPAHALRIEFSVLGPKKRRIRFLSHQVRWKNIFKKLKSES